MLRTSDLEYDLPESAIARVPAAERDAARMLVVSRSEPGMLVHARVRDLPAYLRAGDCMVVNHSRVIPARFLGVRADTGGRVEGLFLGEPVPGVWRTLLQGKRMREGVRVALHGRDGHDSGVALVLIERLDDEVGGWLARVEVPQGSSPDALAVLERVGLTPIPPYIRRAREHAADTVTDDEDRTRYQTVFAAPGLEPVRGSETGAGVAGSVAAPTAGLHLTPGLLAALHAAGVTKHDVSLHVGTGTFRTVEAEFVEQHAMHEEWCSMGTPTRDAILRTRADGGRVLCVGTTAARTVESYAAVPEGQCPAWLATRILITPGYSWRWTDALLTNFHLPRSTLMAMVAALLSRDVGEGVRRLKRAYEEALGSSYRFYSYGDAMLVLP